MGLRYNYAKRNDYPQPISFSDPSEDNFCLLYTSDAADERSSVDLGGRRTIQKKKNSKSRGSHAITVLISVQTQM